MGMRLEQSLAQLRQRVIRKLVAEHVRQRAQDRPVLARLARRERGPAGHLHASLGVDVDCRLLGVCRARQDDIGAVGALVAVGADIDHESAGRDVDLVGAEQECHIEPAGRRHPRRVVAAAAGHEADVERTDP